MRRRSQPSSRGPCLCCCGPRSCSVAASSLSYRSSMPDPAIVEWIYHTDLSVAIREGGLPYPIIGGIHLLAIAWFGGLVLASDLRLLGWLMPGRRFSDLWYQFRPWKRLGFVVVVVTGLLLAWAEPVRLWGSPSFWVKMFLFALVGA